MSLKAMGSVTLLNVNDGAKGDQGNTGATIKKETHQYYLSTSPTSLSGGSWSEMQPEVTAGTYLWERNKITLTDNTVVYSDAVYSSIIDGVLTDVDSINNKITNKVWESDITTKINQYDGSTVSTIRDRVSQNETDITGITTRVSDVESTTDDLGTRMTSAESSITQNADNINLKVSKDSVISEINASPESITISADKVNIEGATIFSTGRLSQTSLNNAYDAKGAAATAKTEAINSANSATDTKLQSYSTTSQMNTAIGTAVNNAVDSIEANAIKSTVSCYYRSTTNTTPTITKNTSIGTSNNTDNAWEYVMPVPKRNAYFFTCEKYTYMDDSVQFSTVRPLDSQTYASKWVSSSDNTYVDGGRIYTHSITTSQLATDAIKSNNYSASPNANSPYSATGSFLDLSTGNFYTPNFGIDNTYGKAYLNGEIIADSGQIGSDSTNYWEIGTKTDYNTNDSAAIIGHGSSYIQSGGWMISSDRIDTRSYDANRKYTYLNNNNTYWDFGLHVPNLTSNNSYENNFVYIRNHESTIPTLEGAWNYLFTIDKNGNVLANTINISTANGLTINGQTIGQMITDGVDGGAYLPLTGGTISGNLTVTGTISGLKTLSINGKTYNGTSAVDVGTIGASYGGTGQTSLINSANALLNALTTGSDVPKDNDYYISQYVNGGNSTTTYHRRPVSKLWEYIKSKINADTTLYTDKFVAKTGGEFTGAITVSDSFTADEATVGNLIVNGAGRFTNGLYGNLTGDVVGDLTGTATSASKLNSTRSFTVGKTAKNVDWSGAVSFSQAEISDNASTTAAGWMSKDDKLKLNGIETGAQVNTITGIKGGSETNYRTGNVNITASNIGLGNLTNDKQVKGLSSGTTSGHLVTWGSDGYTVADSGIAKGSVTTKITLAGTDYSASSNTITITKANLQAAVQDTSLVLMTSAERSKLSSIAVSEGGTIDFSGVTATAPITATVNQTTKAVNITHDTSGATAGTYRSVTVNTYGHVTGGTNPTTLSGYGITDAKIASGVITLGSNTITPLTASSTLDATKLSGTASISTTGNASTATAFTSAASVTLTGDTTGTASSTKNWSVTTTTKKLTTLGRMTSADLSMGSVDYRSKLTTMLASSSMTTNKPGDDGYILNFGWDTDVGWGSQLYLSHTTNPHIKIRAGAGSNGTTTWGTWRTVLDENNYNSYSPSLTGTGATGTWGISISGTATKATQDGDGNTIASTYLKLSGGTMTGAINLPRDKMSINFRPDNTSYCSGLVYGTAGNEALALSTKNAITSFMVVHGSDPSAWTNTTWQTASPTIQTKNKSLYVNERINNGVTPTYNFKVNGTSYLGGNVRISDTNTDTASCELQFNPTLDCLEFIFN